MPRGVEAHARTDDMQCLCPCHASMASSAHGISGIDGEELGGIDSSHILHIRLAHTPPPPSTPPSPVSVNQVGTHATAMPRSCALLQQLS
eukprot:354398-Chlamydomonas_euryale.AAC.3